MIQNLLKSTLGEFAKVDKTETLAFRVLTLERTDLESFVSSCARIAAILTCNFSACSLRDISFAKFVVEFQMYHLFFEERVSAAWSSEPL